MHIWQIVDSKLPVKKGEDIPKCTEERTDLSEQTYHLCTWIESWQK